MGTRCRRGSRQAELFGRSIKPIIVIEENHRLVQLTDELDWTELEQVVQEIRRSKLKNDAGRPPHLRALIGAVVFRATHKMSYRDTEDQIRHYAPARYLCGLTETGWTPDANTIQDFEELLGEDGMARLNEHTVKEAVRQGLADERILVADTTAQEAAIPYPNEMNLMATFLSALAAASRKAGGALKACAGWAADKFRAGKKRLREYRLFAKEKTKAARMKLMREMANLVEDVQSGVAKGLRAAEPYKNRLVGYAKIAHTKAKQLHETMTTLLPQIRYWIRTGFVASNKIVSLHLRELYSVVRGKMGKAVEFGLQWGISRLGGGFLLATVGMNRRELVDTKFAVKAVDHHIALFGKAPEAYAYDRGGYSRENIATLKKKGVKHVGVAPRGRAPWAVGGAMRKKLVNERAQVEGGIGAIKNGRYGFNRPAVRSAAAMAMCGQRAVLGLNLNKLIRGVADRKGMVLVG
jgi:transposase, IS5 family